MPYIRGGFWSEENKDKQNPSDWALFIIQSSVRNIMRCPQLECSKQQTTTHYNKHPNTHIPNLDFPTSRTEKSSQMRKPKRKQVIRNGLLTTSTYYTLINPAIVAYFCFGLCSETIFSIHQKKVLYEGIQNEWRVLQQINIQYITWWTWFVSAANSKILFPSV
jgi:hypothetical protein